MKDFSKSIIYFLLTITCIIILKNAWVSDDSYIGFRTVYNFTHGYGLTFNINERVQSFTNPLWILLISFFYFFTGEAYFTSIALSILITLLSLYFLTVKFSDDLRRTILIFLLAISSKAFIDYSTSGLENPLCNFFIVLFVIAYLSKITVNRKLFLLFLIASLAAVNRLDNLILFIAPLLTQIKYLGKKNILLVLAGLSPLIIWESFSLLYFGFLFPNTYYAKLDSGISTLEYMQQGMRYLINSFSLDPITLLVIAFATISSVIYSVKYKKYYLLSFTISIILYLIYIIKIGGDFMSGRFLTSIFILSLIIITQIKLSSLNKIIFICIVIGISIFSPYTPIKSGPGYRNNELVFYKIVTHGGVADERAWYFPRTGLVNYNKTPFMKSVEKSLDNLIIHGDSITSYSETPEVLGFTAYSIGPNNYIFHHMALSDALMARLPRDKDAEDGWRVGHILRKIPDGYVETLRTGINHIKDKNLALYYDKLTLIIKGDIFDTERLETIFRMNTGKYDYLVDKEFYAGIKR